METKMITIPFDLERAKRIQEGKEEGKITTKSGINVRIVCWDFKDNIYSIIGLIYNEKLKEEIIFSYKLNGCCYEDNAVSINNLVLQVPEYTQYKDGDILIEKDGKCPFIYKDIEDNWCNFYVGININDVLVFRKKGQWCPVTEVKGYANEEQKQQLINALQDSKEPLAKEYLKRFFNIEKEEFKPFDKVLVRDNGEIWRAAFFSHYVKNRIYRYLTIGDISYEECIPYNEETKHLLGTDKPYIK